MTRWPRIAILLSLLLLLLPGLLPGALGDASITIRKTVNRTEAQVGDVLRYTIHFNNTGNNIAQKVWINDTLPQGTRYINDSATSAGGTKTGNYNWTFSNVPVGSHYFYVNVSVTNTAVPGSSLVNLAALNYTNSAGVKQPPSTATASTLFGIRVKTLHFRDDGSRNPNNPVDLMATLPPTRNLDCNIASQCDWDNDGLRGLTLLNANMNFSLPRTFHEWVQWPAMAWYYHLQGGGRVGLWVDNPGAAGSRTINLYLLDVMGSNSTLIVGLSPSKVLDGAPGFEYWEVSIPAVDYYVLPGHSLVIVINVPATNPNPLYFAYDSTAFDSFWAMRTNTYVRVVGVSTTATGSNVSQTLFSHGQSIDVWAVALDPFGSFDISTAWVNVTDPTGSLIRSYAPMTLVYDNSPLRGYVYTFTPAAYPLQGFYNYEVFAEETNGVIVSMNGTFEIRYPVLAFAKVVNPTTVALGQPFTYTLYFNNSGTSQSRILWVNETLPLASADYVSDTAGANNGTQVMPYHWRFLNVSAGSHSFAITMRLRNDAQPPNALVNWVYFNYTDTLYRWEAQVALQRTSSTAGPYLVLRALVSNPQPREGQAFALVTYFNNTGTEAAPVGWLNYTLSPNVQYLGDSAAATGLTFTRTQAGNLLQLRFSNIGVGSHVLQVNMTFREGMAGGTNGTSTVTLQYRSGSGAQPPTQSAIVAAYLHEPNVTLALGFSSAAGDPGDRVTITVHWANLPVQAAAARNLYLNVTLPPELTFRSASAGGTYNPATRIITWTYASMAAGALGSVSADIAIQAGVADGRALPVVAKATFRDDALAARPPVSAYGNLSVTAPVITLVARADRATAEYQDTVTYRLYFNNTGTGRAAYAYVNGTLGPDLTLVSVTGPGSVTWNVAQGSLVIHAVNLTTGGYNALVTARVATAFGAGRPMGATFSLDSADDNGNPYPRQAVTPPAVVLKAPKLDVTLGTDRTSAAPGNRVRYTITIWNNGTALAKGYWVNVSFSPYLTYLSDSSSVVLRRTGNDYSWHLGDLAPGGQVTFTVDFQVNGSAPTDRPIAEVVILDYTEGRGLVTNQTRSQGNLLQIVPAPGLLGNPLVYLLPVLAAVAVGGAVVALKRRSRLEIEEIFVVYKDGTLLAHRSKTLTPDKDEDVLTAMFTAVQEFISDSFQLGDNREVRGLNIGDYTVEIQRGEYIYVAVVFRGLASAKFRTRLLALVREIEGAYHETLVNWSGNMDLVKGMRDRLRVLLKSSR